MTDDDRTEPNSALRTEDPGETPAQRFDERAAELPTGLRTERWLEAERAKWKYTGAARPKFAVIPGPGQESVWDYPRPPKVEPDSRHVTVHYGSRLIADSRRSLRVLETAGPPVFYVPPADIEPDCLREQTETSFCEWKGLAHYWSVVTSDAVIANVAWSYSSPLAGFESIANCVSFYPARLECHVDGERVSPQPGEFYGGWVTMEIVGPFKGTAGSEHW